MEAKSGTEHELILRIQNRLKQTLPGLEAHVKLYPAFRQEELEKADKSKATNSAVMILLFFEKQILKTVFIKRASDNTVHSGQISFPGGKSEPEDKSSEETALRECEEEIGIPASQIRILGELTTLFIPRSNFLVHPIIGFMDKKPIYNSDNKEVDYIIETDVLKHDYNNPDSTTLELFPGYNLDVLGFDLGSDFLWGATGMIFTELLMLLKT